MHKTDHRSLPTAALTASPPRALSRDRRPLRGQDGRLLLDWKDLTAVVGAVILLGCTVQSITWLPLFGLTAAAPLIRRMTVGGPLEIQRHGFAWGAARVVGGVSLAVGLLLMVPASQGLVLELLGACLFIAVGATVDHVARTSPPEPS